MIALCGMRSTLPLGADWPTLRSRSKKGSILVLLAHGRCCLLPWRLLPSIAVLQEPQVPLTPVESLRLAFTKPFREPGNASAPWFYPRMRYTLEHQYAVQIHSRQVASSSHRACARRE